MSNIVLLNSQAHRSLRVHAQAAARYGDNQRFVAVVVNEFPRSPCTTRCFSPRTPTPASSIAEPCWASMTTKTCSWTSVEPWTSIARSICSADPFSPRASDLAIDLDHPRVAPAGDQELFTEAGEPSNYLQSIMGLLRDLKPGLERTRIFIDTLLGLKLIEPMTISARFDDGSKREFTGLYTVNQDQLRDLADAAVLDLFRRGYLQLIYLMIASLEHVSALARRKNRSFLPGAGLQSSGLA